MILGYFIKFIHLVLVLVIILSPFLNLYIKKNVLALLIYLLFQYLSGYNRCGLTTLEYYVMGEEYQQGFLYRLINPLIKVSEDYFDNFLYLFHIMYILILTYQITSQP